MLRFATHGIMSSRYRVPETVRSMTVMTPLTLFEFQILDWFVQTLHHEMLDKAAPVVSYLGDRGWIWLLITALFFIRKSSRRVSITILLALAFSYITANLILKPLVARVRPCDINTAYRLLIDPPTDFSFPSGHTQAAFAAASAINHKYKLLGGAALLLATCIGFSRLYLYVHFVGDVLAGAVIGYLLGSIADTLITEIRYRRYSQHRRKKKPSRP